MGFIAKDSGGGDFKRVPPGVYIGRCFSMIDLGTQTTNGQYGEKQQHVQMDYAQGGGLYFYDIPVSVEFKFHPKTTKTGDASKTRMDLDNVIKVVLDALQGVAYMDDKQVRKLTAEIADPVSGGGLSVRVTA